MSEAAVIPTLTISRKKLHEVVRAQAQTMIDRARRQAYRHAAGIAMSRDPVLAGVLLALAKEVS